MDRVMKILALVIIVSLAFPAAAYSANEGEDDSEAGSEEECSTTCDLSLSELENMRSTPSKIQHILQNLRTAKQPRFNLQPQPEPTPPSSELEYVQESPHPQSDWGWTVSHDYTGWYFESLPLSNSQPIDIRDDYCADNATGTTGTCNLVYYYNSSKEENPWMVWNKSKPDSENDITKIINGKSYWIHVNESGSSGAWEGNEINPIYGTGAWKAYGNPGWNAMGWTSSELNPYENLSSEALQAINEEWNQNYTTQWGNNEQYTGDDIAPYIEEIYPEDSSGVFTWNHTNTTHSNGYWVCNNNQSELPTGYCSGSKPPRMPWQTPYFNVSSVTSSDIVKGEELKVNATIENTAGEEATQNVRLVVPELGLRKIEENVTVGAGGTKELTLTTDIEDYLGDHTAVVYTGNNETRHRGEDTFTISGSYFDVKVDNTNSPIDEGGTLEVNATITNTGDQSGTQDIDLDTGGMTRDTTTETIDPGAQRDVTLEWNTAEGDGGDYTAEVSSEDDTATTEVTVLGEPYFDVSIDSTNSPVQEGDTLTVDATITNTGDQSDTQEIDLAINGTTKDSESLSLAATDSQAITLEWNTGTGDAGTYTAEVSSANETESTGIEVDEEPVEEYSLQVTVDGEGSVDVEPEQATYDPGTEVTLTADPDDGWKFVKWTGDQESTEKEITITMDEDKEITAKFEEQEEEGEAVPAADIALLLLGLSLAVMIYHVKNR